MPARAEQAGDAAADPKDRERANARDPGAGLLVLELPAALDADQQSACKRRRDAQGLPIPAAVQLNLSACQRTWSAMKVEMK
jgi:hypothetical protein